MQHLWVSDWVKVAQSFRLFVTPWTIQSWISPGQNTGVGSLSLPKGIFPTQGSNPGLLHVGRFFTSWASRESQNLWVYSSYLSGCLCHLVMCWLDRVRELSGFVYHSLSNITQVPKMFIDWILRWMNRWMDEWMEKYTKEKKNGWWVGGLMDRLIGEWQTGMLGLLFRGKRYTYTLQCWWCVIISPLWKDQEEREKVARNISFSPLSPAECGPAGLVVSKLLVSGNCTSCESSGASATANSQRGTCSPQRAFSPLHVS